MKKILYILLFSSLSFYPGLALSYTLDLYLDTALAIDTTDTVYFDLANAQVVNNQLILPVSISTNEPVNSLDFSLKYNHAELDYDTITNLAGYLQGLSYQSSVDSAVRYTSSSLVPIGVGVNLVNVKFTLVGQQISSTDFNEVKGYLNGVKCAAVVVNQLSVGLSETDTGMLMNVYPNPSDNAMSISSNQNLTVHILNVLGKMVAPPVHLRKGEVFSLNTAGLPDGLYFIKSSEKRTAIRFIVRH